MKSDHDDIWTAIARNHWEYNKVYDWQYQKQVPKTKMRVSALIHETSWLSIELLQEFEPKNYNRFCARIAGVSTFNHTFDMSTIVPRDLPFAFANWKEYRDYLLDHIIKPEYKELFVNRWKNQNDDDWYKVHVKELILNDIDGTVNGNKRSQRRIQSMSGNESKYHKQELDNLNEWKRSKKKDD